MTPDFDCIVVGAGVVGLAIARDLARSGRSTLIIEREPAVGLGCSSRSSEVIHAGLYYPVGSLKATLCMRGRELMREYTALRGIETRWPGKLVVATQWDQLAALTELRDRGEANGVTNLAWLDARAVQHLEPDLQVVAALDVPSTGVVDSHALMQALLADAEAEGAVVLLRHEVRGVSTDAVLSVRCGPTDNPTEETSLTTRWLINSAGLDAPGLASRVSGLDPAFIPRSYAAKGSYFRLTRRSPFRQLIYPVPQPGGLGIHLTLDLGGGARFGPDVEWLNVAWFDTRDFAPSASRVSAFEAAIRAYWPGLPSGSLVPDYAGVRPKISGPDEPPADFRIDGPEIHGVAGLIQLFGIESPGLTSALAIGEHVTGAIVTAES